MAYCVFCGVELMQGAEKCPLCSTAVCLPKKEMPEQPLFPSPKGYSGEESRLSRIGGMLLISILLLIPAGICILCDLKINGALSWSLYSVGGIFTFYIIGLLPLWFRKPNPVIFSAVDFGAIGGLLLLIDLLTKGGWFLPFALPVTGGFGLITVAVITLTHYLKRGHLYIYGGAFIAIGLFAPLIEFLLALTFGLKILFLWSYYPLVTFLILGIALIVIAICRPLREALKKKLFI